MEQIHGCETSKEAEVMKSLIYHLSKTFFQLDGHIGKMKRANGFQIPLLFEDSMDWNTDNLIVRKLSKMTLPPLQPNMLSKLNDQILKKINLVTSPIIKNS